MNTYTIVFKDRNKYEDVTLRASQINVTDWFVCFVTFGENDAYSCTRYALMEIFRIDEN